MVKVAPSILAANFEHLEEEVKSVIEAGADIIHVDVMDGKFVNNKTPGIEMYQIAKNITNFPVDTHLMVENPEEWIEELFNINKHYSAISNNKKKKNGKENLINDILSFHIEAVKKETVQQLIDKLHEHRIKASIAIKPNTPIEDIKPFLNELDMVLVMTVEPGFGGQKMIEECLKKVKLIRKLSPDIDIEVDGGINIETCEKAKKAGANVIVAGTAIFQSNNRKEIIKKLKNK